MPRRTKQSQQLKMFDDYVRKAIDAGLSIIGETGKNFVYYYMDNQHSLSTSEMPKSMEAFHAALTGTFSDGAKIIEKFISIKLYESLDLTFRERREWTILNYIDNAKKMLENPE